MTDDPRGHEEAALYKARRAELISESEEISRFHDKSVIAVAAGALALSIHLKVDPGGFVFWVLTAARLSLLMSLLSALLGIEASRDAYERERQILDEEACKGVTELTQRAFLRADDNESRKLVDRFNGLTKYSLLVGLVVLTLVPILSPEGLMQNDNKMMPQTSQYDTRSLKPAPAPVNVQSPPVSPSDSGVLAGGKPAPAPVNVVPGSHK